MGKKNQRQRDRRQAKREQFSEPTRHSRGWIVVVAVGAFFAIVLGQYLWLDARGGGEAAGAVTRLTAANGNLSIPLADLDGGRAKFYEHVSPAGAAIRFFVMKGSDGVYRAALDSCEICYLGKKGYVQRGDEMLCRKCGQSFPSALINEVTGGCHPIGVPRTVAGDKLVIGSNELETIDAQAATHATAAASSI